MRRGAAVGVIGVARGAQVLSRRGQGVQDEYGIRLEVRAGSG